MSPFLRPALVFGLLIPTCLLNLAIAGPDPAPTPAQERAAYARLTPELKHAYNALNRVDHRVAGVLIAPEITRAQRLSKSDGLFEIDEWLSHDENWIRMIDKNPGLKQVSLQDLVLKDSVRLDPLALASFSTRLVYVMDLQREKTELRQDLNYSDALQLYKAAEKNYIKTHDDLLLSYFYASTTVDLLNLTSWNPQKQWKHHNKETHLKLYQLARITDQKARVAWSKIASKKLVFGSTHSAGELSVSMAVQRYIQHQPTFAMIPQAAKPQAIHDDLEKTMGPATPGNNLIQRFKVTERKLQEMGDLAMSEKNRAYFTQRDADLKAAAEQQKKLMADPSYRENMRKQLQQHLPPGDGQKRP